jgi:hypothetical protein
MLPDRWLKGTKREPTSPVIWMIWSELVAVAATETNKPLITDAKSTDLASILLLASLHSRNIHVMSVSSDVNVTAVKAGQQQNRGKISALGISDQRLVRGPRAEGHQPLQLLALEQASDH